MSGQINKHTHYSSRAIVVPVVLTWSASPYTNWVGFGGTLLLGTASADPSLLPHSQAYSPLVVFVLCAVLSCFVLLLPLVSCVGLKVFLFFLLGLGLPGAQ